jgi:hypothetical protein
MSENRAEFDAALDRLKTAGIAMRGAQSQVDGYLATASHGEGLESGLTEAQRVWDAASVEYGLAMSAYCKAVAASPKTSPTNT